MLQHRTQLLDCLQQSVVHPALVLGLCSLLSLLPLLHLPPLQSQAEDSLHTIDGRLGSRGMSGDLQMADYIHDVVGVLPALKNLSHFLFYLQNFRRVRLGHLG